MLAQYIKNYFLCQLFLKQLKRFGTTKDSKKPFLLIEWQYLAAELDFLYGQWLYAELFKNSK